MTLFHVSPSCCDTCRCRVWTRGVSVCFHVLLCYCATCCLPICQCVIFSHCHVRLSGRNTWRRRSKFLFGLVIASRFQQQPYSYWTTCPLYVSCPVYTCPFRIGPPVSFLLDHASVSHSRECPFRTATCPKPLHVDVHTDPFHHRTYETALLFREISVIILIKHTTINKVTTK